MLVWQGFHRGAHLNHAAIMDYREFCDIYLPLDGNMFRVALYLLESEQDARDAVQDLYVKLWNRREALDSVQNPQGYAITLLRNICIDRIRRSSAHTALELDESSADVDPPDRDMENAEQIARVRHVLDTLPANQRRIFEMRVLEDRPYEEISAVTGKSAINLRVIVNIVRNKLKTQL